MPFSSVPPARPPSESEEAPPAQGGAPGPSEWADVVARIRSGDPQGAEELYRVFSRGVRFYLCRQLGPEDLEDRVHDTFLAVLQAIHRGDLREPERLLGFVRTVVKRHVAGRIHEAVHRRRQQAALDSGQPVADVRHDPERDLISRQRQQIMEEVLRSVSARDREILTRFYLLEQSQEQICADMRLTETQFRLLKSRAKARFAELGRRKLVRRPVRAFFLRRSAGAGH